MAGREARKLAEEIAKISPHLVHGARMAVSIAALTPPDVVLRMETDICLSSGGGVTVGEAAQQFVREEQPMCLERRVKSVNSCAGHP